MSAHQPFKSPCCGTGHRWLLRARAVWTAWDRFATKPLPRNLDAVLKGFVALLVLLVLAGMADVFAPTRVRESAKRAACNNNLRQIGIACHLYADENGGRFPNALQPLYPAFTDNVRIFSCPSKPSNYSEFLEGSATEKSSSYRLVPGLCSGLPRPCILAYEEPSESHHIDGVHVLYTDGTVEWLKLRPSSPEEVAFRKRLADEAEAARTWSPPAIPTGSGRQEDKP